MPDSLLMTCAAVILEAHGLQIRSLYSQNPVDAHNNKCFPRFYQMLTVANILNKLYMLSQIKVIRLIAK